MFVEFTTMIEKQNRYEIKSKRINNYEIFIS